MTDKNCVICEGRGWLDPNVGHRRCVCNPAVTKYEGVHTITVYDANGKNVWQRAGEFAYDQIAQHHRLYEQWLRDIVANAEATGSEGLMIDAITARRALRRDTECLRGHLSRYQRPAEKVCDVDGCFFARRNMRAMGVVRSTVEGECKYS